MQSPTLSIRCIAVVVALACASVWAGSQAGARPAVSTASLASKGSASLPKMLPGQTATALPNGEWLLVGGSQAQGKSEMQAWLVRADGRKSPLTAGLLTARGGHTATLLASGQILILGGATEAGQLVPQAELWDPKTQQFKVAPTPGLLLRTEHSATVLPDGRVLIAGGLDARNNPLRDVELWNPATGSVDRFTARLNEARAKHQATLLPDGTVLIAGGMAAQGGAVQTPEILDVLAQRVQPIAAETAQSLQASLASKQPPTLFASAPGAEAQNVDAQKPLVLRFGKSIVMNTISAQSVTLVGPGGTEPVQVVPVEQGVMAFVTPTRQLLPASRYTLFINGATDGAGQRLPLTAIGFDTAALGGSSAQAKSAGGVGTGVNAYARSAASAEGTAVAPTTAAILAPAGKPAPSNPGVSVDAQRLAELQADDELFIPTEAHRKSGWISGRADRAQQVPPRNPKLREALYGEQERQQRILAQRAAALGLDLKANPQFSAYAPVSLDDQLASPQRQATAFLAGANDGPAAAAGSPKVRLEWSDMAPAEVLANAKRLDASSAYAEALGGATTLAGQVLRLNGKPLANVTLSVGGVKVKTDEQGEFLLTGIPAGPQVLSIDGRSANLADAQYGVFQYRHDVKAGQANALPFVVWMPKLDTRHAIKIDSPTRAETVLSSPLIPGLQVVLPAGTVIRDADGKVITEVSITPVPVDQTPFPMPFMGVPVFYTLQPGGAVLQGVDGKPRAATLKYPNYGGFGVAESMDLFDYDPYGRGWYVYSSAKVSAADPTMIAATEPFKVYQLTMHSAVPSSGGPGGGGGGGGGGPGPCSGGGGGPGGGGGGGGWSQPSGPDGGGICTGDPVDMTTGHFMHSERDLAVSDVTPIEVERTYRTLDNGHVRVFGVGATHAYETYLTLSTDRTQLTLVLPSGRSVIFQGPGSTPYQVFNSLVGDRDRFQGTRISGVGSSYFILFFKDGAQWVFSKVTARLVWVEDRNGNRTTIERTGPAGFYASRIVSPNGRWLDLKYNANGRISETSDNIGRKFIYTYDDGQRLTEVTDPLGKKRIYTWDTTNNRIISITDPNTNKLVTNEYDGAGRVLKQTMADASTYTLTYTTDAAGKITRVDSKDRRGTVRRAEFNLDGSLAKNTFALGLPEQYSITYEYSLGLLKAMVDGLNRRTEYQHDAVGNVIKVTRLAGTANAVSTSFTHDPVFNQVLTVTNPLTHKTTLGYDTRGNLIKITDPLTNAVTLKYDAQGKPVELISPLIKTTKLTWDGPDLSIMTDPLNRVSYYKTDGAGRVRAMTDPLGNRTFQDWDALNRLTQITNPLGNTIKFGYDNNGFLTTQTDEKNNQTVTAYNNTGQPTSVKDALTQLSTMGYDSAGQLKQSIDRKGQLSSVTYDPLGRTKRVGFGATAAAPTAFKSVIELSWDKANRLLQVVDKTCTNPTTSLNCATAGTTQTTTFTYDDLDRLTKEVTPQGEVNYGYDKADRRTTMTVKNGAPTAQTTQPTITYTWDNANRLTKITQAAGAVNGNVAQVITLGYDAASRRTKTTLANGSSINYTYDDADQLTAMDYKKADGSLIGNLTYTYDKAGRRTSMGGSLAKIDLPATPITDALYDANNRLTRWNGKTFSYDPNGSLIADGTSTYQWDERGQLKGVSTGATGLAAFQYDSQGRRIGKTIGATTTGFLYDGANFIQELAGTSNTSAVDAQLITGGIDEVFQRAKFGNLQSNYPDANNNTILMLDKNQNKIVGYSYEAYGKTKADAASSNTQQYTGRENDNPGNDNGLYYYRARYYMPGCARFISQDEIGWASGQTNGYSYVGGDPVSFTDPSGNIAFLVPLVGKALVGGVLGAAGNIAGTYVSTGGACTNYFRQALNGFLSGAAAGLVGNPLAAAGVAGGLTEATNQVGIDDARKGDLRNLDPNAVGLGAGVSVVAGGVAGKVVGAFLNKAYPRIHPPAGAAATLEGKLGIPVGAAAGGVASAGYNAATGGSSSCPR